MRVTFYRSWVAFPHQRRNIADDINISVHPYGEGEGGNYEFNIEHVGTEPGRHPIGLRLRMFADSWRAFRDLPEFFALLADMDESGTPAGHASHATLDDLTPRLLDLGWTDRTEELAARGAHEHVVGCLICGDKMGDDR